MFVTVLLSGGIDSAACAAFYKRLGFQPSGLFVDYGQVAAPAEAAAATALADHLRMPLRSIVCHGSTSKGEGEVAGRNAALLFAALMEQVQSPALIAIGVHGGTPYFDCSTTFISSCQKLFDGYCAGAVSIAAPFVDWTKAEVVEFARFVDLPLSATYSCEAGKLPPCRTCASCLDREVLLA